MYDDVYSKPEDHGLEIVGVASLDLSYEFDMFVVWQDGNGQLYYASDAGCSCPSPFEYCYGVADLETAAHPQDAIAALDGWVNQYDSKAREEGATTLRKALLDL